MKGLRIVLLGFMMFALLPVSAQDIHFSQHYASPATLNPALTGKHNGVFRVAANYRSQWFSIPGAQPYETFSGSFDAALLRNRFDFDRLGIGVMVFQDKSGNGELTNLTGMLSLAYHKTLDPYGRHTISAGFQGGIVQKRIDFTKLTFEEQFDQELGFDVTAFNGENVAQTSIWYPDFSAGAFLTSAFSENAGFYAGFAFHHLSEPKESFLVQVDQENRLESRITAHGGFIIKLSEYISLNPGALFMTQASARTTTAGVTLGVELSDNAEIFFGGWYRVQQSDALIAMAGVEISGLQIGLSYDINMSDLKAVSNGNGAFEVSVVYIFGKEDPRKISPVKFCPRF